MISPALKARYFGQLDSQNLCPLWCPGGPVIPPSTGCSFPSPSTIRMSYGGTILFPGPTREAKLIYCLKIYLLRWQYPFEDEELQELRHFNLFAMAAYLKDWFQSQSITSAPRKDLEPLKKLEDYRRVNESVSKVVPKTFQYHLRYHHRSVLRRIQGCISAEGRSSTANTGTKAAVLPGKNKCCSFPLLSKICGV